MMIPVEIILLLFSPVFFIFIAFEWLYSEKRGKALYQWRDTAANFALAAMHQAGDFIALLVLLPLMVWLSQFALFSIEFSALGLLILFLVQDLLYYCFHRCSHRIRWLWASHVAHHSSRLMNFSTAFRQSLTYPVSGMWLFWLPLVLIGFDVHLVLAVVAINLAFQFFVHTQSGQHWGPLGWVFNTPAWHRVHHACNPQYIDRNFAGVLIIWDRLFGTFVPEQEPCRYGITDNFQSTNPLKLTFYEWRKMMVLWPRLKGWRNKLKLLFGPPSAFAELSEQYVKELNHEKT